MKESRIELSAEELQLAGEIQKKFDETNATQLINNYEIGKLIHEAYGQEKKYGSGQIEKIAKHLGKGESTLYGFWKLYQNFSESNIEKLAKEKFSTPYKCLKVFGTIGADEIMKIYEEVDTLPEFKERLKAQWNELKAKREDSDPEPNAGIPDSDTDTEEMCDGGTTDKDHQNYPQGEFSLPPEDEPSTGSIEKTNEKPSKDYDDEEPESGDTPDVETSPSSDPYMKPESDEETSKDIRRNLEAYENTDVKKNAGSAVEKTQPPSNDGDSPLKTLEDEHDAQEIPEEELVYIAKSELEKLQRIQKEYDALKSENDFLRNENNNLKRKIKNLSEEPEGQKAEGELEPA